MAALRSLELEPRWMQEVELVRDERSRERDRRREENDDADARADRVVYAGTTDEGSDA